MLRDVGSFSSVVALASFLVPVSVFALILGFLDDRMRVLALVTFALATVGIVMSYVRIAIVAVGVGTAVLAVLLLVGRDTPRRLTVMAVLLVLAAGAGGYLATIVAAGTSEKAGQRARGLAHPLGDASLKARWRTWERSGKETLAHPLGTGIGTVGHATSVRGRDSYTDNAYLKLLQEQGIPAALLFIAGVLGTTFLVGRRLARDGPLRSPVAVAALGGFVSFLTLCLLGEYIELPGKVVAWAMLGIALWHSYGMGEATESAAGEPDAVRA